MEIRFTVTLHKTKETANTVRYDSQEDEPLIRTLYINKAALVDDDGNPYIPEAVDLTVDDDVGEEAPDEADAAE